MHFHANDSSETMTMYLVSSAYDICIVFGMCDCLQKINEINIESQRNTASAVLIPRVSENHSLPRQGATETFSSQFLKLCSDSGGNLLARPVPLTNTWHAHSGRSTAEGNRLLLPNQQTRKAVVQRANETTVEELY